MLAEGWHKGAGTAHAEVDAMRKVDPALLRGATAVVTMEPCDHTGRTGPCSVALIDAGVGRVVYAVDDPGGGGTRRGGPAPCRRRRRRAGGSSPTTPRRSSSGGCSRSGSGDPG
ncbi:deaminase [Curtobacterium sp. MCJR17_043]|uniref:deaminase n=1 Tax=Curtobacterium sp. MCJR17_043 TaxID=2175660 RepID=UPI0032E8744B